MVVKGSDGFQHSGEVQWLESGGSSAGYEHILGTHAKDFFSSSRLSIEKSPEIKQTIYDVIRNGNAHRIPEADGGGTAYIKAINGKEVSVIVGNNGFVVTSHPGLPKNIDL